MSPLVFTLAIVFAVSTAQPIMSDLGTEERYPENNLPRNLDPLGGGNLIREIQNGLLRTRPYLFQRPGRGLDSISLTTFGSSKRLDPLSLQSFGAEKRNGMDEIDRAGFNTFIKKKNFDEIDRSGFDGFVKRNFDEIDRAGFNGFVKRAAV